MGWMTVLRDLHIAGGLLGLAIAPVAMWAFKYGRVHRVAGYAYVGAMLMAVSTSLVLAYVIHSTFLFLVGVFSGYLSISGLSTVRRRGAKGSKLDWALLVTFAVTAGAMVWVGATNHGGAGTILIVFGAIAMVIAVRDARLLPHKVPANHWVPKHLSAMCASYLASLTAFSATTFNFIGSGVVRFLWPTVVGVPLILWAVINWKRKLSPLRTNGELRSVS